MRKTNRDPASLKKAKSALTLLGFLILFFAALSQADAEQAGCLTSGCHSDITRHSVLHRPLKARECMVCHFETSLDRPKNPSDKSLAHRKLIRFSGNQINSTCLTCHDQIKEYLDEPKNPHRKIQEKACTFCHDPHGSDRSRLFKADVFKARCFSCHEKIKNGIDQATSHHSPVSDEKACLNCHAFHHEENPKLLKIQPTQVCLDCHSRKITLTDGKVLDPVGKKIQTLPFVHKPARDQCFACHAPHGGKAEHLLESSVPHTFYSKFDSSKYRLCFDCHSQELATSASTRKTSFRNGSANLHFFHLQRGDKGYGCLTCHEVHATEQARQIRNSTFFQGVEVPIRFQSTQTGGTCTNACHGEKKYDRERAVKNENGR